MSRICAWCAQPLLPKQRWFCSDDCARADFVASQGDYAAENDDSHGESTRWG